MCIFDNTTLRSEFYCTLCSVQCVVCTYVQYQVSDIQFAEFIILPSHFRNKTEIDHSETFNVLLPQLKQLLGLKQSPSAKVTPRENYLMKLRAVITHTLRYVMYNVDCTLYTVHFTLYWEKFCQQIQSTFYPVIVCYLLISPNIITEFNPVLVV